MALDYGALLVRAAGDLVSVFSSLSKITVTSGFQRICSWLTLLPFLLPLKKKKIIFSEKHLSSIVKDILIFSLADYISLTCLCMSSCVKHLDS